MHLHFVCTGNSYRCRLAEAYCRSQIKDSSIQVNSSGTGAELHRLANGPICWYAMRLLKRNNLIPYMTWTEQQTSKAILKNVDLLVCMRPAHLEFCQKELGYEGKFEVWNIPDLNEMDGFIPAIKPNIETDLNHIKLTEQTFALITNKVDELLDKL